MKILLTGATGFLGSTLTAVLASKPGVVLTAASRRSNPGANIRAVLVPDLTALTDWSTALRDQQIVIHTAARAHLAAKGAVNTLAAYRGVNVDGAINLAQQAADAGVKRFIFISSIGVNGNMNTRPFTEASTPNPSDPYAQSKLEAELGLGEIQRHTGMEIVIIRPPLVYGPNAPGNFGSLINWVDKGVPLPLGSVNNKRSLVALGNLVDLIITCIEHPSAANQVFLAGDGEDISTTELLRGVARAMGKPSRLIPVPPSVLMLAAPILGKKAVAQRLLGSLQVDISKARELLGWTPPVSVQDGLRRCFESPAEKDAHQ